ncbi:MAG TPA: conjugal transfer protein TraC [Thermoanaerobacterales bacterium]|nr:conjugal transfer protein TraC [Thermoanaerobacterales bacterium]
MSISTKKVSGVRKKPVFPLFSGKRNKKEKDKGTTDDSMQTVQKWLPVDDIDGGLMKLKGGQVTAVVKVEPAPFTLLSEQEKDRRIKSLYEAFQALSYKVEIFCIPRPIDLDQYLNDLEDLLKETDPGRRPILRGYLNYVRGIVSSAEATERRFYILIPEEKSRADELQKKVREFVALLSAAELKAEICSESEILDMLFCFFNPAQAAFERPGIVSAAPMVKTVEELIKDGVD